MKSSYREIFKVSSIVGGTQVIVLLIGMLKSKVLAVLVGPTGTGLVNLYTTTTSLVGVIAGLGIRSSGVRQIAIANASGDRERLAKTVMVLRWTVRATGVAGGLAVLLFCRTLSFAQFGDDLHVAGMALMSLVLVFDGISGGQSALLQGMRRIRDLAKCRIIGAVIGTITSVIILGLWRENGILPLIIVGSFSSIVISWFYARKVHVPKVTINKKELGAELRGLVGLGFASMVAGLMGTATSYVSRVLITRDLGIEGVGLYAASLALSTVSIGFILQAMGMDLYPRLSAAANDNKEMNRLVNEQTEMGLLLSGPAVLATSALAPYIIMILYSAAYLDAVDVVRWQILGSTLKVVAWPIGTIQLAKARKGAFIATEIVNGVATFILLYLGIKMFGLVGAGIAAFVSYGIFLLISWAVGYRLSGFKWSLSSALTLLAMGLSAAVVFLCVTLIEGLVGTLIATGVSLVVGIGSLMRLRSVMQLDVLAMIKAKLKR